MIEDFAIIKKLFDGSPHRLAWPRTPAFHAGNAGSNPAGDAILNNIQKPIKSTS
jgi:hypothetical protein